MKRSIDWILNCIKNFELQFSYRWQSYMVLNTSMYQNQFAEHRDNFNLNIRKQFFWKNALNYWLLHRWIGQKMGVNEYFTSIAHSPEGRKHTVRYFRWVVSSSYRRGRVWEYVRVIWRKKFSSSTNNAHLLGQLQQHKTLD